MRFQGKAPLAPRVLSVSLLIAEPKRDVSLVFGDLMKIGLYQRKSGSSSNTGGFGLVDALFAMVMAGVMFMALYAGLAFGFNVIKMARENTRATQIMLEKMETVRLYTWTQLTNVGFVPTNKFTVPYYAVGTNNNSSLIYTGQVVIEPSGVDASYAGSMRKITIKLEWCPTGLMRTREMSTYVSRNGMQTYVY
jgi:hypothetical protein